MKGLWYTSVCLLLMSISGCARSMRVFVVGDFTGPLASLHREGRDGILWAVRDLSSKQRIIYHIENLYGLGEKELERKLRAFRPDVILGPFDSATGAMVIPLANTLRIPIIPPTVSASLWSGQKDYMARLVPENLQEIRSLFYLMAEEKVTRPLLVYAEVNEPYARAWVAEFTNFWQTRKEPFRVVSYHSSAKTSFENTVKRVIEWRPRALVLVTPGNEGGLIIQEVKSKIPSLAVYVSGWTMDKHFLKWSGIHGENAIAIQHFVVTHTNTRYQNLYHRFVAQYQNEPSFGFVYGYEAMALAVELYQASRGNLRKQWFTLFPRIFEGLQSFVYLDSYGDATRTLYVMYVSNNQWKVKGER